MIKKTQFKACDDTKIIKLQKWVTITEKRKLAKTDTEKEVKRTVKQDCQVSVMQLKENFSNAFDKFFSHFYRDVHQRDVLKLKRENLGPGDLYVWMDFSENYACKYDRETQSHYYGASRENVVLHTGIVYQQSEKKSFCTVSKSTRKDPSAIMAHLSPILEKHLTPGITSLHLQSDSPSNQYRNKNMFYLVTQYIPQKFPQLTEIFYNYTEAGHGKGACDGVGAKAKNICDAAVKSGKDVNTFEITVEVLKEKCKKIYIDTVEETPMKDIDKLIPDSLETFKGTMAAHQFTWTKEFPKKVHFNSVSCYACKPGTECKHFKLENSPWLLVAPEAEEIVDEDDPLPVPVATANKRNKGSKASNQHQQGAIHKGDWIAVKYGQHWYPGMFFFNASY